MKLIYAATILILTLKEKWTGTLISHKQTLISSFLLLFSSSHQTPPSHPQLPPHKQTVSHHTGESLLLTSSSPSLAAEASSSSHRGVPALHILLPLFSGGGFLLPQDGRFVSAVAARGGVRRGSGNISKLFNIEQLKKIEAISTFKLRIKNTKVTFNL